VKQTLYPCVNITLNKLWESLNFRSGECWRSEEGVAGHHSGHSSVPLLQLVVTKAS